jgi:hypothetical protein
MSAFKALNILARTTTTIPESPRPTSRRALNALTSPNHRVVIRSTVTITMDVHIPNRHTPVNVMRIPEAVVERTVNKRRTMV